MAVKDLGQDTTNKVNVLDKGYVRLVKWVGDDLDPVNSARASFAKESDSFEGRDLRLLDYLAREPHTEPFRHSFLTFEVKAPLVVARQWWRYAVGHRHSDPMVAWSEASRRYVTHLEEFYVPHRIRTAPDNKKQGSGGYMDSEDSENWALTFEHVQEHCLEVYDQAIKEGMAPELARGFLPSDFQYVYWRWSTSLQGVLFFLEQRLDSHAQWEIREYAKVVDHFVWKTFPKCHMVWAKNNPKFAEVSDIAKVKRQ